MRFFISSLLSLLILLSGCIGHRHIIVKDIKTNYEVEIREDQLKAFLLISNRVIVKSIEASSLVNNEDLM